jgi:hypothetical protein
MVGNRPVFKTPSANVAVAIESLKRLPDTLEIQNIQEDLQAYLQAAMVQTNERVVGPSVSGATSRSRQHSIDLSDLVNIAHAHPLAQTTALWTIELLVSIQELTEATTAIVETLPAMIIAASATAAITTTTTGAPTTGVMTTGTTVVKDNNTVTNEIAMMAIMISVTTSTTVTYVLALNRELGTVRPMKPVVA